MAKCQPTAEPSAFSAHADRPSRPAPSPRRKIPPIRYARGPWPCIDAPVRFGWSLDNAARRLPFFDVLKRMRWHDISPALSVVADLVTEEDMSARRLVARVVEYLGPTAMADHDIERDRLRAADNAARQPYTPRPDFSGILKYRQKRAKARAPETVDEIVKRHERESIRACAFTYELHACGEVMSGTGEFGLLFSMNDALSAAIRDHIRLYSCGWMIGDGVSTLLDRAVQAGEAPRCVTMRLVKDEHSAHIEDDRGRKYSLWKPFFTLEMAWMGRSTRTPIVVADRTLATPYLWSAVPAGARAALSRLRVTPECFNDLVFDLLTPLHPTMEPVGETLRLDVRFDHVVATTLATSTLGRA